MPLVSSPVRSVVNSPAGSVLGDAGGGGGASTALSIVQAAHESGERVAYWDVQDSTSLTPNINPNAAAFSAISDGGVVGTVFDKSPCTGYDTFTDWRDAEAISGLASTIEGEPGISPGGVNRPIYRAGSPAYLEFDGTADRIELLAFANASPMTAVFACRKDAGDASGIFLRRENANPFAGNFQDGVTASNSFSGSGVTTRVDGVAIADNRDALHDALDDVAWHVVTIQGYSMSSSGTFRIFSTESFWIDGDLAAFCCLPDPSASDLAAIEADFASIVGISI